MSLTGTNRCLFSLTDTVGSVGLASLTFPPHNERINPTFLYRMEHDHTYDIRFLSTNNSKTILLERLRQMNFASPNASSSSISVSQFFRCVLSKHFMVGIVIPSLLSPQGNTIHLPMIHKSKLSYASSDSTIVLLTYSALFYYILLFSCSYLKSFNLNVLPLSLPYPTVCHSFFSNSYSRLPTSLFRFFRSRTVYSTLYCPYYP